MDADHDVVGTECIGEGFGRGFEGERVGQGSAADGAVGSGVRGGHVGAFVSRLLL